MFPVRCYTCNSVIGQHWTKCEECSEDGLKKGDILDSLMQHRICCRRMFLSHVDLVFEQKKYPCRDVVLDSCETVLKEK